MKAKTPVRWISNRQEGSSENWFIELFITSTLASVTDAPFIRPAVNSVWQFCPLVNLKTYPQVEPPWIRATALEKTGRNFPHFRHTYCASSLQLRLMI
jgi:hypothetical protein